MSCEQKEEATASEDERRRKGEKLNRETVRREDAVPLILPKSNTLNKGLIILFSTLKPRESVYIIRLQSAYSVLCVLWITVTQLTAYPHPVATRLHNEENLLAHSGLVRFTLFGRDKAFPI